jgi:geranylgeranyl diphosphate synthase type I
MTTVLPAPLLRSRELVSPALRRAVDRLDPRTREVASYHFGWSDADGQPVEGNGGKALRPALALASAQAAGADAETGVPGAVAVELVHNFSLLHDDLMDGDTQRRHRATAWTVFSPARAILTGDALLTLATSVVLDEGGSPGWAAARLLADATARLIAGQADDVAFETQDTVSLPACLQMAAGKTGALLGCAAAIGAVLADADARTVDALRAFGERLGLAFQLVDDLLGIWGDPQVTGKPVLSDLRARKKTLPVVAALAARTPASAELHALLSDPDGHDEPQLVRAAHLIEAAGGRAWATNEAERQLDAAYQELDAARIRRDARADLAELAAFTVRRTS